MLHYHLNTNDFDNLIDAFKTIPLSTSILNLSHSTNLFLEETFEGFRQLPKNIDTIDLSWIPYGPKTTKALIEILRSSSEHVKAISLAGTLDKKEHEDSIAILQALSEKLTTLDIAWNELHAMSNDKFIAFFRAIKPNFRTLNLAGNGLSQKNSATLAAAFDSLSQLETLNLSHNQLNKKTSIESLQILKPLSINLRNLDLSHNNLGDSKNLIALLFPLNFSEKLVNLNLSWNNLGNGSTFRTVCKTLPKKLEVLDASNNQLGCKTGDQLAADLKILSDIPTLTTLDLSWNDFNSNSNKLAKALRAIPVNVKTLILSGNGGLGTSLKEVLEAVSPGVDKLSLSENQLGKRTCVELVGAMEVLSNIVTLDLSENNLDELLTDTLAQMLTALSKTVTTLRLAHNQLGYKTGFQLGQILHGLRNKNILTLDLSGNQLQEKTVDEFKTFLREMPSSLRTLDLSNNGLGLKTEEDLIEIIRACPDLEVLNLSGNHFTTFSLESLKRIRSYATHIRSVIFDNDLQMTNTKLPSFDNFNKISFNYQPSPHVKQEKKPLILSEEGSKEGKNITLNNMSEPLTPPPVWKSAIPFFTKFSKEKGECPPSNHFAICAGI